MVRAAEARQHADRGEDGIGRLEPPAQRLDGVVGQWLAEHRACGAQDFPVLARLARREGCEEAPLHPSLGVRVGAVLLGVGGARKDDVGARGAGIAMVALVDHEGLGADARGVELVGREQPEHVHPAAHHGIEVLAVRAGQEAEVERADAAGGRVQHVEAMPVRHQHPGLCCKLPAGREDRGAVGPGDGALAHDQHRALGIAQHACKVVAAVEQGRERARAVADDGRPVGEFGRLADHRHREMAGDLPLADTRVQERCLPSRIAADDKQGVGLFDPGDSGVERVEVASRRVDARPVLPAVEIGRAEQPHEVAEGEHAFRVHQITSDSADPLASKTLQLGCDRGRRRRASWFLQPAIALHPGTVEPAALQPVDGEARLVGQPLLVDLLVDTGQHAQHLRTSRIDADRGPDSVEHVDAVGAHQLPRPRDEGGGLGGERADGADVDQVAGQLGGQRLLDIGADLQVLARAGEKFGNLRPLGPVARVGFGEDGTAEQHVAQDRRERRGIVRELRAGGGFKLCDEGAGLADGDRVAAAGGDGGVGAGCGVRGRKERGDKGDGKPCPIAPCLSHRTAARGGTYSWSWILSS